MVSVCKQWPRPLLVVTLLWLTAVPPLVARVLVASSTHLPDANGGRGKLDPGYVPEVVEPVLLKPENELKKDEDKKGKEKGNSRKDSIFYAKDTNKTKPECNLWAVDPEIYTKISKSVQGGAVLLDYTLEFPEYETNPLMVNMSKNFMTKRWARAYTKHGKTLLSLSFNYAVLSLTMLSFGVEKLEIDVVDAPKGCFGKFTPEQRLERIMEVVMSDFRMSYEERQWVGEFDYACHQIIADNDGVAAFKYQCCQRVEEGSRIECFDDLSVKWINLMFFLVVTLKICAFLVGPLFLQHWAYSESLKQSDYLVKLKDPMEKSILVKKLKVPGDGSPRPSEEMKEFSKFRGIVKNITPERINFVSFRKLQVQVDHRRLMTEKSVPVGLFTFLYENIIWCGIRRWEPFRSCCKESIFGSCSPKFLWLKLRKRSECNNSCKKFCSWDHVFNLLGGLVLLLAVPIPYYIRVAIYYAYEEAHVSARKDAVKELDLRYPWEHTLIHYVDPSHAVMVMLYITYGLAFILLAAFRSCNASKFDPIAVGAVQDMRNVNRVECVRLILAHIILPFEKFGLCGFIVAILYWPIVLPICFVVGICYCTPTLYLLGRFLVHNRPKFLRNTPIPTPLDHFSYTSTARHTLSKGTTSFETCLFLENISPEKKEATNESCFSCEINRNACYTAFLSVIVGLLCSVSMLSVLLLFADVLGFIVEVFVFTLMGAIVNASSAAKYLMLAFWIMVYSSSCFNNMYNKYMDLNDHIFKFIKAKLKEDIKEVTMLREDMQKNTAFKYFNQKDFKELRDMEIEEELDSDFETEDQRHNLLGKYKGYGSASDSIEYIDDKLHWRVHHLVLFVDNGDVPRIPKTLFHEICKLNAPGCPGPFHLSLLEALKQLSYMVVFIIFVLITVMAFGDAYKLSSTNQMMVTLAGGFLPFVVRFVIKPKAAAVELNSYSFEGKIHQIINHFNELWPVYDLSFKVDRTEDPCTPVPAPDGDAPEGGGDDAGDDANQGLAEPPPGAFRGHQPYIQGPSCGRGTEPTHVDLLITIRDDDDDENLHQGGSGSPPHDNSLPPEEPGSSYNINNPTNATMPNQDRPERADRRVGSGNVGSGGGHGNQSTETPPDGDRPDGHLETPFRHIDSPDSHSDRPDRHADRPNRHIDGPDMHRDRPNRYVDGPEKYMDRPERQIDRPFRHYDSPDRYITSPDRHIDRHYDNGTYLRDAGYGTMPHSHRPERRYDSGRPDYGHYDSSRGYGYIYQNMGEGREAPISRSWNRPSYASTSTQVMTPPGTGGRPVDLMVDLNRGGVKVRNQTSLDGGGPDNGVVVQQPRGSPYKRVPSQGSKDESSV